MFISYKHRKEFCNDLKTIYQANTEKEAKENLSEIKKTMAITIF